MKTVRPVTAIGIKMRDIHPARPQMTLCGNDSYFQPLPHSVYANILCPLSRCQLCLLLGGCLPWPVTDGGHCNSESMSESESESEETDLLEPPTVRVSPAERRRLMCFCCSGG